MIDIPRKKERGRREHQRGQGRKKPVRTKKNTEEKAAAMWPPSGAGE